MIWQIQIQLNEKLYIRDPSQSEVGKNIVKQGALMIEQMGLEEFTFKKLATQLKTNESSVYRYFENKHRLLLYLVDWYWRWIEYQVIVQTNNIADAVQKIDILIDILLLQVEGDLVGGPEMDKQTLHRLVINEGSKSYLTHHVHEDNQQQLFSPYKDLCARIAGIFLEVNPGYRYARSLSSTLVETAHFQYFFMHHLPRLTDFHPVKDEKEIGHFLKHMVLSALLPAAAAPLASRR